MDVNALAVPGRFERIRNPDHAFRAAEKKKAVFV